MPDIEMLDDPDGWVSIGTTKQIRHETESGVLVADGTERDSDDNWFPRSQLRVDHKGNLYASEWILEEKGLA